MTAAAVLAAAVFGSISYASASIPQIAGIESTGAGLVVTWDLLENADLYAVFRKEEGGKWECIAKVPAVEEVREAAATDSAPDAEEPAGEMTPETALPVTTGTWTDSLIIPGKEYQYYVRAYDSQSHQWSKTEETGTTGIWDVTPGQITAGTVLTEEAVAALGEDAFFSVEEISDETFARMWKKSFKEYCTMDRADLRYIRCLHKDIDGNIKAGELVMHVVVAETVCGIFRQLYDASYPIESMILVDEFDADDETSIMSNNTSAFNFRLVAGTDEISNHAYGLAIDINPYYNVYYIPSLEYVFPPEGWEYLDREADFPYKLMPGDLCYNLFTEAGFEWGGWWTYNTDYQHFQYVY